MPINLYKPSCIHPTVKFSWLDAVNLYGSIKIGEGSFIGPWVEIQTNVRIGKNCRIQSHSFLCENTKLGDNVFFSHGAKTCNDKYPKVNNKDWKPLKTIIGNNVCIGTNATILGGVTIGDNAIIGAGAIVCKNIGKNEIWAGYRARFIRKL